MRVWPRRGDTPDGPDGSGHPPVVVHARVLDGEHLFLAVRGESVPLVLETPVGEVELPTETGADPVGPLTTATVRLEDHAGPEPAVELRVQARAGRRVVPLDPSDVPLPATSDGPGLDSPPIPDGRAVWEVGTDAGLVLRRRPAPPGVCVLALHGRHDDVAVVLAPGPAEEVEVRRHDAVVARLPLTRGDGVRRLRLDGLDGLDGLAAGEGGGLHADGVPLTRRRPQVARPQRATELPPLPPATGLELRWTAAGHLVLAPATRPGPAPERT